MCGFCNLLTGETHWTEAGTDAGRDVAPPTGHARYLDRHTRVALVNRILEHYGCTVASWGRKYIVRSRTGQTALVDHLPQIWASIETIARKPVDPLDPALLARLRRAAPVAPG